MPDRLLRQGSSSRPVAYGAAVLAVLAATGLSWLLWHGAPGAPLSLFMIAVVFAAWFGGLGPALAATALSIGGVLLLPHRPDLAGLVARLVGFAAVGSTIGLVVESLTRARRQAQEQAQLLEDQALELELANQELTESMDEAQHSREVAETAEQRYRLLFERNPLPMWVYDLETLAFLAVNDAAVARYGWTRAEFLGMTLRDIRPAEDVPALLASHRTSASGLTRSGTFRHRTRAGEVLQVEIHSHDVEFAGRAARLVLVHDVTARRRAEAELRSTGERLRALIEASPLPIVAFDPEARVRSWSRAAERTFGWSEAEVLGRPFPGVPHEHAAESHELRARLRAGHALTGYRTARCRSDGSLVEVSVSAAPLREAGGELIGFMAVYEDVTERERTAQALRASEEQLRQAQKMEAVGRLAGGVAHDFNNILTAIQSYAELLALDLDPDSPHRADVDEIQRAAQRAATLTRQLLAFSRQQVLRPELLDVNAIVAETEKLLHRVIGEDVELVTRLQPDPGPVCADAGQLVQVLLNLAVNARDAMPEGGRLVIETADAELDETAAAQHPDATPGRYVMLRVSDSGHGMDAATQERMFDPFFTTKEPGKGTGLGLATVYGIVQQSGGSIWVYSEPGEGATFRIYLPRATGTEPTAPPAPAASPAEPVPPATILLVEDEASVRTVVARTLVMEGHTVLEAANGREALERAAAHPGPIDLVITDMVMPELRGGALAARIREARLEARLLVMSGYTEEAAGRQAILEAGDAFLEKPFTASRLLEKVRTVLAR